MIKYFEELNIISNKFLSTKKQYIKDSLKEQYCNSRNKFEISRFEFNSKINAKTLF